MKQLHRVNSRTQQAIQFCQQGEFEQARLTLQELEQEHGLNAEACFLMGSVLGQLGQYEGALGYFQRAIDLAPENIHFAKQLAAGMNIFIDNQYGQLVSG